MTKDSTNKAYFLALASAVFLSTTAIFIRYLTLNYQIPALVLAFWRDVFVVLTVLPILLITKKETLALNKRQWVYLVSYGFILAIFNALWTLSVALNGAAVATVLCYCSAAFTALLGRWLLKEELDWIKGLAITLSLSGCVLVAGAYDAAVWQTNLLGIVSGIATGLAYAAYSLMGRTAKDHQLGPWKTLLYIFSFASVFLLAMNLIPGLGLPGAAARPADLFWLGTDLSGWIPLFLLAAVPTVMGFGLYNVSLQHLPASVVNLIATSEPVFTTIVAYFAFGEVFSFIQLLGGLMVMGGVLVLRLKKKPAAL